MKIMPVEWHLEGGSLQLESCMRISPSVEPLNMSTLSVGGRGVSGVGSCYQYQPSGMVVLPCSQYVTARTEKPLVYTFDVQSFIVPDQGNLFYRYTPYTTPVPTGGLDLDISRPSCPTIGPQILTLTQFMQPGDAVPRWPGSISFDAPYGIFNLYQGGITVTEFAVGQRISLGGTTHTVQSLTPVPVTVTWQIKLS